MILLRNADKANVGTNQVTVSLALAILFGASNASGAEHNWYMTTTTVHTCESVNGWIAFAKTRRVSAECYEIPAGMLVDVFDTRDGFTRVEPQGQNGEEHADTTLIAHAWDVLRPVR